MNVMTSKNYNLLDAEGKERVLVLQTKYEKLMPLEKLAFMDLCGFVSTRDAAAEADALANRGKLKHYMNARLADVRTRDPGFVVLQQDVTVPSNKTPANAGSYDNASSDASIRKLIQPSLFGEGEAAVRKQRKSLYEKIGMEGEEEEQEAEEETANRGEPAGVPGQYTYRSNAYQALRLAHSFPQHLNVRPSTKDDTQTANMMNVTGMPLYEHELREWFDALDSNKAGYLELEDFNGFMRSLDRDIGIEDEYARLEQEGSRLASDGKLCFEAFAYLVLRFARAYVMEHLLGQLFITKHFNFPVDEADPLSDISGVQTRRQRERGSPSLHHRNRSTARFHSAVGIGSCAPIFRGSDGSGRPLATSLPYDTRENALGRGTPSAPGATGGVGAPRCDTSLVGTSNDCMDRKRSGERLRRRISRQDPVVPTLASSSLPHLRSFTMDEDGGFSVVYQPEPEMTGAPSLSNSQLITGGGGTDHSGTTAPPPPPPSGMFALPLAEGSETSVEASKISHVDGGISVSRNSTFRNSPPPYPSAALLYPHKNVGTFATMTGDRSPGPCYSTSSPLLSSGVSNTRAKTFSSADPCSGPSLNAASTEGMRSSNNNHHNHNIGDSVAGASIGLVSPNTAPRARPNHLPFGEEASPSSVGTSTLPNGKTSLLQNKPPTAPISVPSPAPASSQEIVEDTVPMVHSTTVPVSVLEGQYVLLFLPPPRDVPESSLPFPTQMSTAATSLLSNLAAGAGANSTGVNEGRASTTSLQGTIGRTSTLSMKGGSIKASSVSKSSGNDGGATQVRSPRVLKDPTGEGKQLPVLKGSSTGDVLSGRSSPSLSSTLRGPLQATSATLASMPRASVSHVSGKNVGSSVAQSPLLGSTTTTLPAEVDRFSTTRRTEVLAAAAGVSTLLCHQDRCTATTRARQKLLTFYNLLMQQLRGEATNEKDLDHIETEDDEEDEEESRVDMNDEDDEPEGGMTTLAVFRGGGVSPETDSPLEMKLPYANTPRRHDPAALNAEDYALDVNSSEPSPNEGRHREEVDEEDFALARIKGSSRGRRPEIRRRKGRSSEQRVSGPIGGECSTGQSNTYSSRLKAGSESSGAFVRTMQSGGSLGRLSEQEDQFFRRASPLHNGDSAAVQGTPLDGDTDTGEEEQHGDKVSAGRQNPLHPYEAEYESRETMLNENRLLSLFPHRVAVVEVHYSTTTLLPAVTPAVRSGTTPDGATSFAVSNEDKDASIDWISQNSLSPGMQKEVDRADRAEKTSAKAALMCSITTPPNSSKSTAGLISCSLDWVRETQRLVALCFFQLLFHSSPPPLTLTTVHPTVASHGSWSGNVQALLSGLSGECGFGSTTTPMVVKSTDAATGGVLPSPGSVAPSPTLSTKSLNNSLFFSATTGTIGGDPFYSNGASMPNGRYPALIDTTLGPQTTTGANALPLKLGEDWKIRLRCMAQIRGSCFNLVAATKDTNVTAIDKNVQGTNHHHHHGSRHRRLSGTNSSTVEESAAGWSTAVNLAAPSLKSRGGTPPPAPATHPLAPSGIGANVHSTGVSVSSPSQTGANSGSAARVLATDPHAPHTGSSPTPPSSNLPPTVDSVEEIQQQQKTLLRQPPLAFATGLDESIMKENPFYGGWYSVHSPSAYRRIVRYCDIHSWPAVVLIDPNGEIVTINALGMIEEELRQAVVLSTSNSSIPPPPYSLFPIPPVVGEAGNIAESGQSGDLVHNSSLDGVNESCLDSRGIACNSVGRYVKTHMESLLQEIKEVSASHHQQQLSGTRRSTTINGTNYPSTATSPRQHTTGGTALPPSVRTSINMELSSGAGGVGGGNMVINPSLESAGGGAVSLNSSLCFQGRDGGGGNPNTATVGLNLQSTVTASSDAGTARISTVSTLSRPTVNDLYPPPSLDGRPGDLHEPDALLPNSNGFLDTVSVSPSPSAPRQSVQDGNAIRTSQNHLEKEEHSTSVDASALKNHRNASSGGNWGLNEKGDYRAAHHQQCLSSRSDDSFQSGAPNTVSPVTAIGPGGALTRASNSTTTTPAITTPTASGQFAPCPGFPVLSGATRPPTVPRSGSSTNTNSPNGSPTRTSVPHFGVANAEIHTGTAALLQVPPLPPTAPRSSSSACGNTPRQGSYIMVSPRIPEEMNTTKASSASASNTEEGVAPMDSVWIGMKSSFPWFPSPFALTSKRSTVEQERNYPLSNNNGNKRSTKTRKEKKNKLIASRRRKGMYNLFREGISSSESKVRGGSIPPLSGTAFSLEDKNISTENDNHQKHESHAVCEGTTFAVELKRNISSPREGSSKRIPSGEEEVGHTSSCVSPFQRSFVADSVGMEYIPSSGVSVEHVLVHNGGVLAPDLDDVRSPELPLTGSCTISRPAQGEGLSSGTVHCEIPAAHAVTSDGHRNLAEAQRNRSSEQNLSLHPTPSALRNSEQCSDSGSKPHSTQYWLDQSVRIRTIIRLKEEEKVVGATSISSTQPSLWVPVVSNNRLREGLPLTFTSPVSASSVQNPPAVAHREMQGAPGEEDGSTPQGMELLRLSTSLSTCQMTSAHHHQKTMTATSSDILTEEKYIPRNDHRKNTLRDLPCTDEDEKLAQPKKNTGFPIDDESNDDDSTNDSRTTSSPRPHPFNSCDNTQDCKCSEEEIPHPHGTRGGSAGDDETVAPNEETDRRRAARVGCRSGTHHSRRTTNTTVTGTNFDEIADRREKSLSESSLSPASFTISSVGSAMQLVMNEKSPEGNSPCYGQPGRSTRERTQPARECSDMEQEAPTSLFSIANADGAPRFSGDLQSTEAVKNAFVAAIRPTGPGNDSYPEKMRKEDKPSGLPFGPAGCSVEYAPELVTKVEDSFYTEANGGSLPSPTHILFFFGASWHPGMNDMVTKVTSLTNRIHGIQKIKKTHHSHKKMSCSSSHAHESLEKEKKKNKKTKKRKQQPYTRRHSLHQPFSSDEDRQVREENSEMSSISASRSETSNRSDPMKMDQEKVVSPVLGKQAEDNCLEVANNGFSLNPNNDGGNSVLSKALAAAAASGFSSFHPDGVEEESRVELSEIRKEEIQGMPSLSIGSSSRSTSASSSSSASFTASQPERTNESMTKVKSSKLVHIRHQTNNPYGNMEDVDENIDRCSLVPQGKRMEPPASGMGTDQELEESLFKSFGADVIDDPMVEEEEETEETDMENGLFKHLANANGHRGLKSIPIGDARHSTSEGEEKSYGKQNPDSSATSSGSESSGDEEGSEDQESEEDVTPSSLSLSCPFNQTKNFSKIVWNTNNGDTNSCPYSYSELDMTNANKKNKKEKRASNMEDSTADNADEDSEIHSSDSSKCEASSQSSIDATDRERLKQLKKEAKAHKKQVKAMKRAQKLYDKRRLKQEEEDFVEKKCIIQWASSPIRVQVVFISLDDSYESLKKSISKMPKSWRCVSPFVFPRWRELVNADGKPLVQGVLQTASSMTADVVSTTPFSSVQFLAVPNSLSVSEDSPSQAGDPIRERAADEAASTTERRSDVLSEIAVPHVAAPHSSSLASPSGTSQLPLSRRRTNMLARNSPIFTLPITFNRGGSSVYSLSGGFRMPVGLASPSFGMGSPSTFHQFSPLQTLLPDNETIDHQVEHLGGKPNKESSFTTNARRIALEKDIRTNESEQNHEPLKESVSLKSMSSVRWSATPHIEIQKEIELLQTQYHVCNLPRLLIMMPSAPESCPTDTKHPALAAEVDVSSKTDWYVVQRHAEREVQLDEKGKQFPWGSLDFNVEMEAESPEGLSTDVKNASRERKSKDGSEEGDSVKNVLEPKRTKKSLGKKTKVPIRKKKQSKQQVVEEVEKSISASDEDEHSKDEEKRNFEKIEVKDGDIAKEMQPSTINKSKHFVSRMWSTDRFNLFRSVKTTTPACMLAYAFQHFYSVQTGRYNVLPRPVFPVDYLELQHECSSLFFAVVEPFRPFSLQPEDVFPAIVSPEHLSDKKSLKKVRRKTKKLKTSQSVDIQGSTFPHPIHPAAFVPEGLSGRSTNYGSAESILSPAGQKRQKGHRKKTGLLSSWDFSCLPEKEESIHLQLRPFVDGSICVLLCAFGEVPHDVHAESIQVMKEVETWLRGKMEERRNRIFGVKLPPLFYVPPAVTLRKRFAQKSTVSKEQIGIGPERYESPAESKMGSASMLAVGSGIIARHSNGSSTVFSAATAGVTGTSVSGGVEAPSAISSLPLPPSVLDPVPNVAPTGTHTSDTTGENEGTADEERNHNVIDDNITNKKKVAPVVNEEDSSTSSFPMKDRPFPRIVMLDTIWTNDLTLYQERNREAGESLMENSGQHETKNAVSTTVEKSGISEKKKIKKKKGGKKKKTKKKVKDKKSRQRSTSSSSNTSTASINSSRCTSSDSTASEVAKSLVPGSCGIPETSAASRKAKETLLKNEKKVEKSNSASLILHHRHEVEALQEYLYGPFLQQHDITASPPRAGEVFLVVLTGVPSRRKVHVWRRSDKETIGNATTVGGSASISSNNNNNNNNAASMASITSDVIAPVASSIAGMSSPSASTATTGASVSRVPSVECSAGSTSVFPGSGSRPLVSPPGGSPGVSSVGRGGLIEAALLRRSVSPPLSRGGAIRHAGATGLPGATTGSGSPSSLPLRGAQLSPPVSLSSSAPTVTPAQIQKNRGNVPLLSPCQMSPVLLSSGTTTTTTATSVTRGTGAVLGPLPDSPRIIPPPTAEDSMLFVNDSEGCDKGPTITMPTPALGTAAVQNSTTVSGGDSPPSQCYRLPLPLEPILHFLSTCVLGEEISQTSTTS